MCIYIYIIRFQPKIFDFPKLKQRSQEKNDSWESWKSKDSNYSAKLSRFILETMCWNIKPKEKHSPKNRAISEGNEFQELETKSVQKSIIAVQRVESPHPQKKQKQYKIICLENMLEIRSKSNLGIATWSTQAKRITRWQNKETGSKKRFLWMKPSVRKCKNTNQQQRCGESEPWKKGPPRISNIFSSKKAAPKKNMKHNNSSNAQTVCQKSIASNKKEITIFRAKHCAKTSMGSKKKYGFQKKKELILFFRAKHFAKKQEWDPKFSMGFKKIGTHTFGYFLAVLFLRLNWNPFQTE